ncbi:uncharacterized protein Z518_04396 [Rhinocladiella mackenziei CBS 650.93]|uniref:Annexin n=1 Tax=Rhinocladiella mackenziei CBS 650.93 TaxID=1442369 RepID=A0A0D2JBD6_9EURO|nr:uncharacterized protein Z518_04396 [Rhinocladiella mackenziei CBS 650.93]KIX06420.1 hypothetical protein Z518_04396 [Rhinocladiella mackenziei CBS 650.93]
MPSMLEVRDDRRSRSKSPSGRDRGRSRSRSRDLRDSPDRSDNRRSSKKYILSEPESESESEDDQKYRHTRSSRKYYDSDDDDRQRRTKNSKKYEDDSDEDERYRSYKSSQDPWRRDDPPSDDDRTYRRSKKKSDSDSDRRRDGREKSSRKKYDDSEESGSEAHRRNSRSHDYVNQNGRGSYGYPPGAYTESRPHETRHMSYVGADPRYAPPGGFPGDAPPRPQQRMSSYSGQGGMQYAEVDRFQYAQPDGNVSYKYNDGRTNVPAPYAERRPNHERSRPKDYKHRGDDYRLEKYEARERKDKRDTEDKYETREPKNKKLYDDDNKYGSSPENVTKRMSTLAVGAGLGAATLGVAQHHSHDGGKPPASPLLEAYKGTYQSISPMPSALVLAHHQDDSDLSDLDLDLDDDSDDPGSDIKRQIRKLEKEKEKYLQEQRQSNGLSSNTRETRPRRLSNLDTNYEIREPGSGQRDRANSNVSIISPGGPGKKKTVSFYDPTNDAKRIAAALSGTRSAPNPRPLIEILPSLSTDDLLALRAEYKNHAKISGQGINIAKHIKMRIPGSLGKACYTTALGRWESEAYWANSWYQGGASRRELLIESLMGRSNSDIREIKNCFKDKKYNDDLEKCIRTELKADKFRVAILLALEERRMPESSPLDINLVKEDVANLAHALESAGGETDMIKIIVVRSDAHLREVLRVFERTYHINFARQMISKSRNLVGETLAHILNGALNRPMRDALLLHQAISETAPGKERTELLVSRLVRLHWEPKHLEKVKNVFQERYGKGVEESIKREVWAQMKTPEGRMCAEFCVELVESSDPDNNRRR